MKNLNEINFAKIAAFVFGFKDKVVTFDVRKLLAFDLSTGAVTEFLSQYSMLVSMEAFLYQRKIEAMGELAIIRAEMDTKIRSTWDDSNGKMTEGGVKALVDSHKSVTLQKENLDETEFQYKQIQSLVGAISIKYSALTERIYKG